MERDELIKKLIAFDSSIGEFCEESILSRLRAQKVPLAEVSLCLILLFFHIILFIKLVEVQQNGCSRVNNKYDCSRFFKKS